MEVPFDRILLLASGAALLLLGALILSVGAGRGLNRALAAVVAARGAAMLLPYLSTSNDWAWVALRLQPYFALAIAPLAVYCLVTWPRGSAVRRPLAGFLALGAVVAIELAYALRHELYATLAAGEPVNGALRAAPDIQYTAFGPLSVVLFAGPLLLAVLGFRVAMHYRSRAEAPGAATDLLVAGGLTLGALFDGSNRLSAMVGLLDAGQAYPWLPWGWTVYILPLAALVPAILTLLVLTAGRSFAPRPLHVMEGRIIAIGLIAFFSGFLRLALATDPDIAGHPLVLALLGVWRLLMPVMVAYAMVLDAWNGLDARVPEAVAWSLVASATLAASALAALVVGAQVAAPAPQLAALLAALGIALAAGPLGRLARPLAYRLLRQATPPEARTPVRPSGPP